MSVVTVGPVCPANQLPSLQQWHPDVPQLTLEGIRGEQHVDAALASQLGSGRSASGLQIRFVQTASPSSLHEQVLQPSNQRPVGQSRQDEGAGRTLGHASKLQPNSGLRMTIVPSGHSLASRGQTAWHDLDGARLTRAHASREDRVGPLFPVNHSPLLQQ